MSNLDQLEHRVAAERANLARSVDALAATVAPGRVAEQVGAAVEGYGGAVGRQVWMAARRNPAAFALVGAGLGLLLTGAGTRADTQGPERPSTRHPDEAFEGFDARMADADAAMKREMTGTMPRRPNASRLRSALDHGLEHLPKEARDRVVNARRAAIKAQEAVEARAKRAARKTRAFAYEQPLATGALALGLGALVGALLPNTSREDALLGAKRDALMKEAENVLRAEMESLHAAAKARMGSTTESRCAG